MKLGIDIEFGYFFGMFSAPLIVDSQKKNVFGNDHLGRIAEVRPNPVELNNSLDFEYETLESNLIRVCKKNPKIRFQLVTNHHTMPCGCHIHYDDSNDDKSLKLYEKINEIIIDTIGKLNPKIRKETKFYKPDAIRKKPYGLEIITLPSTILFHPGLLDLISLLIIKNKKKNTISNFYKQMKSISQLLGNTDYVDEWPLPAYFSKGGIYTIDIQNNQLSINKISDSKISVLISSNVINIRKPELVVNNLKEALKINQEFEKLVNNKRINFKQQ